MHLYNRDYNKITVQEKKEYNAILLEEKNHTLIGRINLYDSYPEAIKHYLSLFPNNHIYLSDIKKSTDMGHVNNCFKELIHNTQTKEQDVLRFINHEYHAFYIIGSVFTAAGFPFGHHDAYVFPEFCLGNDYRADYLLIGSNSGGYEFVFVELEKPNGRVTLKDGKPGQVIRSGSFQVEDWKRWVDSRFCKLTSFFNAEKGDKAKDLPKEFLAFDGTRMHYVVVAGTRNDYTDETYHQRRLRLKESNITLLHYDNLCDASEKLQELPTF